MTFLNNPYLVFATVGLIIQIIVLFLLFYGYSQKRKQKFERHARVMTTAVVLHLVMILSTMIPALISALIPVFIIPHVSGLTSIVTLIHVPLGLTAVSLGVWLVVSWRFSGVKGCFKRRKFMLATIVTWPTALLLGITLYFILYWSALTG